MSKGFKVALVGIILVGMLLFGMLYSSQKPSRGVPDGCISYNDGCNRCSRMEDGTWACTIVWCPEDNYRKGITCTKYKEGYDPKPGERFRKFFDKD